MNVVWVTLELTHRLLLERIAEPQHSKREIDQWCCYSNTVKTGQVNISYNNNNS